MTEGPSPAPANNDLNYTDEVWRKLLHLVALAIPIGYHFVSRPAAVGIVFGIFAVSLFVDLARFRGWRIQRLWRPFVAPIVRPKEATNFTGASHILLSGWLCPLMFSRPAAALAMAAIILGDIAAALIGRRWGRHRYAGNRSWEGSTAFFVAALLGALLVPGVPWPLGLAAAALAAFVEGVSLHVDDNLTVPLAVGLFVHLALRII